MLDDEFSQKSWSDRMRENDFADGLRSSWRVLVDGVVVAYTPTRHHRDGHLNTCQCFCDHIKSAFDAIRNGTEWYWNDNPNDLTAEQWIAWHEKRLGMKFSSDVRVVEPGDYYPLAPNIDNI